jgi:integrase
MSDSPFAETTTMPRKKTRRQSPGSAWHWKQTDCWYYTRPGSNQRIPLFDEEGQRIRGQHNHEAAQQALQRIQHPQPEPAPAPADLALPPAPWLVARVCSEYLRYCQQGATKGTLSHSHHRCATSILNDLCRFCGALPVTQLTSSHIHDWVHSHSSWKSPVSQRDALTIVRAAFNHAATHFQVAPPLKLWKLPPSRPRLHSFSVEEERLLLQATDPPFADFLFAAVHTGLRPFCELARLTADAVVQTERGMLWRVYSSKTNKTRKIPIRPEVAELTRRLMASAPPGSGVALFRNRRGNPWSKQTGVERFLRLKQKLNWNKDPLHKRYSCYTCRHTFAHRMLSGYWNGGVGCSIETLAELMGNTPKVAFDHYGKEWGQHYQEPLWRALGVPPLPPEPVDKHGSERPQRSAATKQQARAQRPRSR